MLLGLEMNHPSRLFVVPYLQENFIHSFFLQKATASDVEDSQGLVYRS